MERTQINNLKNTRRVMVSEIQKNSMKQGNKPASCVVSEQASARVQQQQWNDNNYKAISDFC